jgi:hypothetical protein
MFIPEKTPMGEAEYRAFPAINYSTLKHARKSLLHYRQALEAPPDPELSQKLAVFSAVHARVLEPFTFNDQFAVYDGRRDKRTKAYQSFLLEHEGKLILTPAELEQVDAMAEAVLDHPWVAEVLAAERTLCEHTAVWDDHDAGPCKAKMDVSHHTGTELWSIDLKCFGGTDPSFIAREGARRGWPLQHAHYLHAGAVLWEEQLDRIPTRAFNVVVEAKEPHDVVVVEWSTETMDAAFAEHRALLMTVAEGERSGKWPGRHRDPYLPVLITPPNYLL